ncbi:MAG: DUF3558 domain-containing protein [Pseudonocardia sp.]|uniref:DUF3558 domain-containing protein n=1 Tax=unclassified Pseudonocardia TaxID=2619320 RepID=UPI001ACF1EC2|nr:MULTISPECIES: DUF3558 domain-containing protein [unclassified Pseudonocardia]MBN9112708.1 DUF3558 domain-containing protein [Pseudonocardia sp.]
MRKHLRVGYLIAVLVLSGCGVERLSGEETSSRASAEVAPPVQVVDSCELLTDEQRGRLGVGPGRDVGSPLEGVKFCGWRSAVRNGDSFQAGTYPEQYRIADVTQNYPNPKAATVSGRPALSTASDADFSDRSCMMFVELPDGRLGLVSYFWEGTPGQSTHEFACSRATTALEMVLATIGSG